MMEFTQEDVKKLWPIRDKESYKGTFGKVGIITGSLHMPGASVISTTAAVRSGAGLTTVNAPIENFLILGTHVPEAMLYDRKDSLKAFYEGLDSILIGPGLGEFDKNILKELIQNFKGTLVIDADGLTFVSEFLDDIKKRDARTIITPHFGEMARILDVDIKEVTLNQEEYAKKLSDNMIVVLKGSETIVASQNEVYHHNRGNTGLAKGGSGDALAGMILGFSNRYDNLIDAVNSAVFMHGYTAEYVSKFKAVEAMTAMDIVNYLGESMLHVKK